MDRYDEWLGRRKEEHSELGRLIPIVEREGNIQAKLLLSMRSELLDKLLINGDTLANRIVVQPKLYPTSRVQGQDGLPKDRPQLRLSEEFRIVLSDLLMQLVDLHRGRRLCGLISESTIVVWQAPRAGSLSWRAKLVPEYTPTDSDDLMHQDFVQLADMLERIIGPEIPRDAQHLLQLLRSRPPRPDYVLTQISHHPCTWGADDIVHNTYVICDSLKHDSCQLTGDLFSLAMLDPIFSEVSQGHEKKAAPSQLKATVGIGIHDHWERFVL
ncbi:hypothetical protein Tsubulata_032015 [Turnera subulata]|uniref:Uncharacterized protein n=1 Tax=Turnera subulata TaxID=218843 RepID=A0A9Q0FXN2_9ROSI|nr:hypothetical protein Tsubulata_032015 [Turnera subulata]